MKEPGPRSDSSGLPFYYEFSYQRKASKPLPLILTNGKAILHQLLVEQFPGGGGGEDSRIDPVTIADENVPRTISVLMSPAQLRDWSQKGPVLHERKELLDGAYFEDENRNDAMAALIDSENG